MVLCYILAKLLKIYSKMIRVDKKILILWRELINLTTNYEKE